MKQALTLQQKWWVAVASIVLLYMAGFYISGREGIEHLRLSMLPFLLCVALLYTLLAFGWFLIMEYVLGKIGEAFGTMNSRYGLMIFYMFGCLLVLVAGLTVSNFQAPFRQWFWPFWVGDPEMSALMTRAYYGLLAYLTVCGFMALANRNIWYNKESLQDKAIQMEKENLRSQINALNNQVNPHFLFNSLSILSSLVRQNAEKSEEFIQQLSKAYHYILDLRDQEVVPLAAELEFLSAYSFLLETRFAGKFKVHLQLNDDLVRRAFIAPLTLQILVENSVKHNRMSEKEPLMIYISSVGGYLVVRNRIRERGGEVVSTGLGLQNIMNRYVMLTHKPVWAGVREGDFVVEIPLLAD